jgi:hypothetical protein
MEDNPQELLNRIEYEFQELNMLYMNHLQIPDDNEIQTNIKTLLKRINENLGKLMKLIQDNPPNNNHIPLRTRDINEKIKRIKNNIDDYEINSDSTNTIWNIFYLEYKTTIFYTAVLIIIFIAFLIILLFPR